MTKKEMKKLHNVMELHFSILDYNILTENKEAFLRVKDSVKMPKITWYLTAMIYAYVECNIADSNNQAITGGIESASGRVENSLHYEGKALDFRIWGLDSTQQKKLAVNMQEFLGNDFDVILEKDHIHCEYDPKEKSDTFKADRDKMLESLGEYEQLTTLKAFVDMEITHYVTTPEWLVPDIIPFRDDGRELKLLSLFGQSNGDLSWRLYDYSSGAECEVIPCTSYDEAVGILTRLLLDIKISKSVINVARKNNIELDRNKLLEFYQKETDRGKENIEKMEAAINEKKQELDAYQREIEVLGEIEALDSTRMENS